MPCMTRQLPRPGTLLLKINKYNSYFKATVKTTTLNADDLKPISGVYRMPALREKIIKPWWLWTA